MKAYGGVDLYLHAFLTSAVDGGEWSASRPGCFTPRERAPGTHWIGGWVGSSAGLDAVKRHISSPRRESNPRTPIVQPVAHNFVYFKFFGGETGRQKTSLYYPRVLQCEYFDTPRAARQTTGLKCQKRRHPEAHPQAPSTHTWHFPSPRTLLWSPISSFCHIPELQEDLIRGQWLHNLEKYIRYLTTVAVCSVDMEADTYNGMLDSASFPMGTRVSFPGGKAAGAWRWPLTSI
jgi:hypothetical protein